MGKDNKDDDIIIEPETDTDMLASARTLGGNEDTQVKKLKKKLKDCERKARENLDGWQRLKADMANARKGESERIEREKARAVEKVVESLLPALDSFDSAMQGSAWAEQDDAWRSGMEFVYNQLVQSLEAHGVLAFGSIGDTFDASVHEAADGEGDTVSKVLRKGYKTAHTVIRPARVILGNKK